MNLFTSLPIETFLNILLHESINDIDCFCRSSKQFNNLIWNNDNFWKQKFITDFDHVPEEIISDWKQVYKNYGKVYVFGGNEYGQLGLGDNQNRIIPTLLGNIKAKSISCGDSHTMIINLDNNVWSFGLNGYGQLGLGDNYDRNIPTILSNMGQNFKAKSVSCGEDHTMMIDFDDNVWSFGDNQHGQLSLKGDLDINIPHSILSKGNKIKAKSISCGSNHTMIIDLYNNVWGFGFNRYGQLGLGDNKDRIKPTPILSQGDKIKAKFVSCGDYHTMMIDLDDNVWSFGDNQYGQLGLGDNQRRDIPTLLENIKARSISCGRWHTMIIDLSNNVLAFGNNDYGQLGLGDNQNRYIPTLLKNIKVKSISCVKWHTMIIDLSNNILALGSNSNGQLGLGNDQERNIPTPILSQGDKIKAKSISCGRWHTMIIDLSNNILAFGSNNNGQLGLGNDQERNMPIVLSHMGQNIKARSISCGHNYTIIIS
jgi:alpha-tubulin suppressor-like RCC1 family protein